MGSSRVKPAIGQKVYVTKQHIRLATGKEPSAPLVMRVIDHRNGGIAAENLQDGNAAVVQDDGYLFSVRDVGDKYGV